LARAYAALGSSRKLLRNLPVSAFLGEHQQRPFPAGEGTWSSAPFTQIASQQDARDGYVKLWFVGPHIEPPRCSGCGGRMKWYRSRLTETGGAMIEHLFSCSSCYQFEVVGTHRRTGPKAPDEVHAPASDRAVRLG
jgi:hypothetical protein